jgi:hypothetical protein
MTSKKVTKADRLLAFRGAHDKSYIIPNKIREGLKQLGDDWKYEDDFMKLIGIKSKNDLSPFREQFKDFIVEAGKERARKLVWVGTKAFAETLRSTQS